MGPDSLEGRWPDITRHFHAALELSPPDRSAYLDALADPVVVAEVRALLLSHDQAGSFLSTPVIAPDGSAVLAEKEPYPRDAQVAGFRLLERLGSGGFGVVYLALDGSLDRRVAIKVTPDRGEEARTMARLEHENIVTVFSRHADAEKHLSLICMQYVPGPTLESLLAALAGGPADGPSWRDAIAALSTEPAESTAVSLADGEIFRRGASDVLVWIALRLAEALAYAHEKGVLHLDVKPSNVLFDRNGNPRLTDFNVSASATPADQQVLGGTFRYMAPEHLAALREPGAARLDGRADVYSLGKMIRESFTRLAVPIPDDIGRVLDRAIDPTREKRQQTAGRLVKEMKSVIERREIERLLPAAGPLVRFAEKRPLLALTLGCFVPQIAGSLINISYNAARIVSTLSPSQQQAFETLVLGYNAVIYPAALAVILAIITPLRDVTRSPDPAPGRQERLRAHARRAPGLVILLSSLGWLPGAVFFPLAIHLMAPPVGIPVFVHFAISFVLSWLVALTYSFLLVKFLALRVLYPRLWEGETDIRARAARELRASVGNTTRLYPLGALVPLFAAILLLWATPASALAAEPGSFRKLLLLLMGLAGIGVLASTRATRILSATLAALTAQPTRADRA